MSEIQRRSNNRDRVLQYLQAHGSATNAELIVIGGYRFGARIKELRAEYEIQTVPVASGLFRYDYKGVKPMPLLSLMEGGA